MVNHHDHSGGNLKLAFFVNIAFTVIEVVGGFFTNSIAIMSDALHDLGDSLSLGLAWYLEKKAEDKKADNEFSFGYARFRLLGALINATILITGSIYIIYEAINRFQEAEPIKSQWMMGIAVLGVLSNGYAAWKVKKGHSLNDKVISWHLLEDVLGWCAVFLVSIVLQFTDWYFLDPALSIAITIFILYGVGKRLKETLYLLLQGVPEGVDMDQIRKILEEVEYVKSVHHTRVWSLDGQHHVLTSHLVLENITSYKQIDEVRQSALEALREYDFEHHTLQLEFDRSTCNLQ